MSSSARFGVERVREADWRFVVAAVLVGGFSLTMAWHGLANGELATALGALLFLPTSAFFVLIGLSHRRPEYGSP
jgi:hypothetical protein